MLSIHYVSIMIQVFYIDWQLLWKCDRTMNIGANAHGERTVSTKQPQVTDLTSVDSWAQVTSERYWASFQVTRLFHKATVSPCDHFLAATYVFVVWNFTRLITRLKSWVFLVLFTSIWWGSTQLQSIYYLRRILIPRPPKVCRRFKRRSRFCCSTWSMYMSKTGNPVKNITMNSSVLLSLRMPWCSLTVVSSFLFVIPHLSLSRSVS